jgi:hypothetical protein
MSAPIGKLALVAGPHVVVLMTTDHVAAMLGMPRPLVWMAGWVGWIPAVRNGHRLYFDSVEVSAWLRERAARRA